jgi:hypothetical protein
MKVEFSPNAEAALFSSSQKVVGTFFPVGTFPTFSWQNDDVVVRNNLTQFFHSRFLPRLQHASVFNDVSNLWIPKSMCARVV